jgi:VWFA-related protein
VFPAQVELVTVDVVVREKKGGLLTDLTPADFEIKEDGVGQAISSFEAVRLPDAPAEKPPLPPPVSSNLDPEVRNARTFVVVFDNLHMTAFQARRAKTAVAEFLKTGVREGDRVTLVSTGGEAWWSTRMEAGREELIGLLKRLDGRFIPDSSRERVTDYEAMRIHVYSDGEVEARVARRFETYGVTNNSVGSGSSDTTRIGDTDPYVRGRAADVYFQSVTKNRLTLEIMERSLESLAPAKGRKSMILVSEGFIYDPNLDEFKRVVESARHSNAAIYFLDTRGLEGMPVYLTAEFGPALPEQDMGAVFAESFEASEGSESLAADSGGFSVKNTNDLSRGIQKIADETRAYYLLGYNPTNTARDGRFRKIEVKVNRKGVEVRARKGYFAPSDSKTALDKKPGFDPVIQAALDSPYDFEQIPLRMTAYVFDETLMGKASALVAADVDVSGFGFEEKDGRFVDTLEFLMVVAHRETGEFFRYDQKVDMKLLPATRQRLVTAWFPIVRDFELAVGGYQAKIVVRDKNSGRVGTVMHNFEVPPLGGLRISSPILTDALEKTPEDPEGPPRPKMLARRTFHSTPGSALFCSFDVYGAAKPAANGMPRVSAGYLIRSKSGEVVTRVEPSVIKPTSLGRLSRIVGTSLEGVAAGDYQLELELKDEIAGKTLSVQEPFTVLPPGTT